jgi:hypothetical protein
MEFTARTALTVTELAMQDQVKADQREGFKITNTSPMPEWEDVTPGFEVVAGGHMFTYSKIIEVHAIRYGGSFGGPNTWGL